MRRTLWIKFVLIAILALAAAYISWPSTQNLVIKTWNRDVSLRQGLDLKGGAHLIYEADTSKIDKSQVTAAMEGVRGVIEGRVNGLGVTEPDIRVSSVGEKPAMIIDLPGISDIEKAKQIIGSTAKLEFKDMLGQTVLEGKDLVPQGASAVPQQQASASGSGTLNADTWQVNISLTSEGKTKFAQATTANIGKPIGIFLDNQLVSNPVVQSAITDGQAVITGNFNALSAHDFAIKLNYGALPVPITLTQEQTIGASLGSDAINQSLIAGVIGIMLIFLFIIAYYGWCGVIATLALLVYALVNIALYKLLPVTMTLAGIAGFIISMGIAIDTNILTFERLKEELRLKKPMPVAIQEAFRRAWTSIRDSHISGLISASIIFFFGSGSIRGFALVLIIGTLLSLFSAITVTRTWMLLVSGSRYQSILNLAKSRKNEESTSDHRHFNIIATRSRWYTLSTVLIIPGLISFFVWGLPIGIDFKGGTSQEIHFESTRPAIDAIRETLKGESASGLSVQTSGNQDIIVHFANQPGKEARTIGNQILSDLKGHYTHIKENGFENIGGSVAASTTSKALWAVALTSLAIILFIAWSFGAVPKPASSWRFGVTAILALAHDILFVIGAFSLIGHFFPGVEVDALFITALLTILGFSVNDTIVVFDRIRENLRRTPGKPFAEITNSSLNQTLARSLNTSMTVLIVLSSLLLLGGVSIRNFILALTLGVAIGTYSSIFNATPLLVTWQGWVDRNSVKK